MKRIKNYRSFNEGRSGNLTPEEVYQRASSHKKWYYLEDFEKELQAGIAVEMEHTKNPDEARRIALDHLYEDPEYYEKLRNAGLVDEPEALKHLNSK